MRRKLLYANPHNLGDMLAPILPQLLFGEYFDLLPYFRYNQADEAVTSIGSTLSWFSKDAPVTVWGTGYDPAYHHHPNNGLKGKNSWKVKAVRGPLSRDLFELRDCALGDPALLLPRVYTPKSCEGGLYFSHIDTKVIEGIESISVRCTNPWPLIDKITSSKFVMADSLHAAIIAHAYGVPWAHWLPKGGHSAEFKWLDWCASIGVEHKVFSTNEVDAASTWWYNQSFNNPDLNKLHDSWS